MLSSDSSLSNVAGLALAVAVVTLVGLALLILMWVFRSGPLGILNDICNGAGALLSVGLALALYKQHQGPSQQLALPALIAVIVGALIAIVGSALVMSGTTGFFLAGMYTATGYALIGLWLLAFNYGNLGHPGPVTLGLITGVVMALGLAAIPSIFMGIDAFKDAAWHTWLGQVGFAGWAILYPIWCLRLWHLLRMM